MTDELLKFLAENPANLSGLHKLIEKMNTVDIADVFEVLGKEKCVEIFRFLPKSMAADVFSYIVPEKQQVIVEGLTDDEVGKMIDKLFVDDAVDFIEEMPANVVKRVLQSVGEDKRRLINHLLQYPEDSAGSIMTTEYVDLREDSTVREAFDAIRSTGVDKETIYTCYVTRRDKLLVGVISAKTLLLARSQDRIGDIMNTNPVYAQTADDQETIADSFKRYSLLAMPVVDKEKRLVGIVTVDDIVQVMEEETTEDFEKMAALTPSDEPYLTTSIFKLAKNRITWLMVLMISSTFTSMLIAGYEESLSVLLMMFVPRLMNTGGNAGSQASTLIIRGMAVGEIEFRDILKVWLREIGIAALCGLALGIVNFAQIYFMNGRDMNLSLTVSFALFFIIVIAKSVGCILPMVAKKLRIDPAIMASPMITTILDAASLLIYFSIARMLMGL